MSVSERTQKKMGIFEIYNTEKNMPKDTWKMTEINQQQIFVMVQLIRIFL